jgi:hypothetical protein
VQDIRQASQRIGRGRKCVAFQIHQAADDIARFLDDLPPWRSCGSFLPSPGLGKPTIRSRMPLRAAQAGNLEEAIALAKRVVELSEKTLPSDHPFIKTSRDNLAALHWEKGDEIGALNRRVAALYRAQAKSRKMAAEKCSS